MRDESSFTKCGGDGEAEVAGGLEKGIPGRGGA